MFGGQFLKAQRIYQKNSQNESFLDFPYNFIIVFCFTIEPLVEKLSLTCFWAIFGPQLKFFSNISTSTKDTEKFSFTII